MRSAPTPRRCWRSNFGLSFWLCLPLAGILAALLGHPAGLPGAAAAGRLSGHRHARVRRDHPPRADQLGAGHQRLCRHHRHPAPDLLRPAVQCQRHRASPPSSASSSRRCTAPIFLFYVILALALLTNWVTLRLRRLPVGRAWEALREDEIACRSLGINTTNTKLTAFAIGAGFGGFAGSFFAARQGFISPESFTFMESAMVLAIVVLGGMGSQIGVAIAAIAMIGGTEILRELDWLKHIFGPDFEPTQYRMLLFGLAMVLLMIWKPRGLDLLPPALDLPARAPRGARRHGQGGARLMSAAAAPLLDVEHLTMRFGGLVAIDDLSFCGRARRDHRHHRPQRRRQDHGLQLHHRLLQADQRAHAAEPRRRSPPPARSTR